MTLVAGFGEIFENLGSLAIALLISVSSYNLIILAPFYKERIENPIVPVIVKPIIK
jgi:hypothetical protein